jgi:hypothetical protein
MAEIIIKRQFSLPACAVAMKVYIDGILCEKVRFGNDIKIPIKSGEHYIFCEAGGVKSGNVYFEVMQNDKKIIQFKAGFENISYSFLS